jgi:S-DNA-T family DNA segregation ATPase FtsK/SpoIIIE
LGDLTGTNADGSKGGSGSEDEMYNAAVEVMLETGQASVSMLQRRLKLGYGRAARIMDDMEANGVVGPFDGAKPRKLLITRDEWEENSSRT